VQLLRKAYPGGVRGRADHFSRVCACDYDVRSGILVSACSGSFFSLILQLLAFLIGVYVGK
jgi:hypothetical protein